MTRHSKYAGWHPDSKKPEGARRTECPNCGWTYGTHSHDCNAGRRRRSGYEAAKTGQSRECPYLAQYGNEIAAWYQGYDDYKEMQK